MSGLHIQHKRNFHVIRWAVALIILVALAAYAYFGVRWYNTGEISPLPLPVAATDTSIDESTVTEEQLLKHTTAATAPRYLEIPKLHVAQARVSKAGVTDRNMLDVPKHIDDAAWYVKSASPGSGVGAVLINGHSSGLTRPGAFAKLKTLVAGDQVSIERGDGKRFTYEVYDVREMPLEWLNKVGMKEMMYSARPEKEGLSLLADAGKWIPKEKVFDRRVLVRATIIE